MLLNTARTLFPGAMGPDGFISCFDHLIDDSILRRKLILKGGPGVGKSTFMRRVHAALCANGEPSTLYFCSGDPDSLDGVAVPHAGLLILDGTAPHIVDPEIPGARDSIINLGECLNEPAMRPRLPHIRACMGDHAACSRRARACLAAAAALAKANAATLLAATDQARLWAMTQALVQAVLSRDAPKEAAPAVRPVITDALTPKGEISLIGENAPPRVIRLLFHWGMDGTPVLRRLSAAVQAAGYSVEEHLCPLVPGRLLHLTIPALATLVTTGEQLSAEQLIALSGIGVRDIEPECSVRREDAPDLPENGSQALHIQRRGFLPPDLPVHTVIPQCVVRRRGYAAVHGIVRQGFQHGQGVAAVDAVSLHSRTHPLEAW